MPKMKNPFRIKESPYGGSKGKTLKRQLTYPEKQKLWEERSHICPKCHHRIESIRDADFHHIKLISKGGKTIPSNIRIEHTKCHRAEPTHHKTRTKKIRLF